MVDRWTDLFVEIAVLKIRKEYYIISQHVVLFRASDIPYQYYMSRYGEYVSEN